MMTESAQKLTHKTTINTKYIPRQYYTQILYILYACIGEYEIIAYFYTPQGHFLKIYFYMYM
jgi:hypothetical protein